LVVLHPLQHKEGKKLTEQRGGSTLRTGALDTHRAWRTRRDKRQ
jgi:hypothetical protein